MNNTIINFEKEEVDNYIVSDFFSRKIDLSDIITEDVKKEYFVTYKMEDNDKLERISYDIYRSTDYWDILLLINFSDALFDMSYDFDTYSTSVDVYLEDFKEINSLGFSAQRLEELKVEFYEKNRIINEENRYISVIPPVKLQGFLKLIKQKGVVW